MAVPPDESSHTTDPVTRPAEDVTRAAPRPTATANFTPEPVGSVLGPPHVPGHKVGAEIDRGGTDVVYTAIDLVFNREVAIKTLLPGRPFDADAVRRFDTEAHVTARLQHPAVPPVFAVGRLGDGRPYTVMKLIRGRNMGQLLKERPSPAHGLTRVLAAFELVCQAVGYAHARGVLHRDLKPSNVMIGEFGEVQVMDWGLAKEGVAAGRTARVDDSRDDPWGTGVPSIVPLPVPAGPPATDATQAGRALGTPAYMAPEQARGDWARVGPWSDVFALGGILVDILTGQPPFVADTALGSLVLAGTGNVADAFARLDASGADPALLALTKRCLAPEPQHRPADGKVLAEAIATYRAGVEARVRKAEAERVAATAKEREAELRAAAETEAKRAAEERADEADRRAKAERANAEAQRARRRTQLLLAGAVAAVLVVVAAAGWLRDLAGDRGAKGPSGRDDAEAKVADPREREVARAALKQAADFRKQHKFREAVDAIAQAGKLATGLDDVVAEVRREKADIEFARDLDDIRGRRSTWIPNPAGDSGRLDTDGLADAYSAAFAKRGFAITGRADPAAAKRVADSPIRAELLRALDDWALAEKNPEAADRVWDVAHKAGPATDPATQLRSPESRRDPAKQVRLEEVAESVSATLLVAGIMERSKGGGDALPLLSFAQTKYPNDFDVTLTLAVWHHAHATRRVPPEQIGNHLRQALAHYRTARALRPEHPAVLSNLGLLLHVTGDSSAALAVLREATKLHPKEYAARYNLGTVLLAVNQAVEAEVELREATQLSPNYAAAHAGLGAALIRLKRGGDAFVALQRALQLDSNQPIAHANIGLLLIDAQKADLAIGHFKKAIELAPRFAQAHYGLGKALEAKKDEAGAAAAYREAAKLDPKRYPDLAKKYPPEK